MKGTPFFVGAGVLAVAAGSSAATAQMVDGHTIVSLQDIRWAGHRRPSQQLGTVGHHLRRPEGWPAAQNAV